MTPLVNIVNSYTDVKVIIDPSDTIPVGGYLEILIPRKWMYSITQTNSLIENEINCAAYQNLDDSIKCELIPSENTNY